MDAGKLSICGEESFGTGSDHIREKDGIWYHFLSNYLDSLLIIVAKISNVVNIVVGFGSWLLCYNQFFKEVDMVL